MTRFDWLAHSLRFGQQFDGSVKLTGELPRLCLDEQRPAEHRWAQRAREGGGLGAVAKTRGKVASEGVRQSAHAHRRGSHAGRLSDLHQSLG